MTKTSTQKEWHWGKCEHCSRGFLSARSTRKYCSDSCRYKAFVKRKKESQQIIVTIIQVKKKPSLRVRLARLLHKFASIPF